MSNHVHLIASAKNENLADILRDFKKFTSKQIIKAAQNNHLESRKEWVLTIFKAGAEKTVTMLITNFGDKIISQKKYTHLPLLFKN
jgi:hypothetical protein